MIDIIKKFSQKSGSDNFKIDLTNDNNVIFIDNNKVINSFSIGELESNLNLLQTFKNYIPIRKNKDIVNYNIVDKWQEPDWIYRFLVSVDNERWFADNYPEYLVSLNVPPRNPKYIYSYGTVIYLNTLEMEERYLLETYLGIKIENKYEYV